MNLLIVDDDLHVIEGIERNLDWERLHIDQAFPVLMKQLELKLADDELSACQQRTVTLYAKGLTCEADTLGSCGYVYIAIYPTQR